VAPDPLSGRAVDGGIIIDELEGHIRRSTRITLVSGDFVRAVMYCSELRSFIAEASVRFAAATMSY
jgi:hypothetical protein